MSHARRRFVAAGAALAHRPRRLAPAHRRPAARRTSAPRAPYDAKTPTSIGLRRRRHLRRPGGLEDRAPGAQARRQRGRRGGRDRRGARRHRALQLGHRRRRLLRALRRPHRQGRARSTAARRRRRAMPHDAFIDPETGKPYQLHPRAGHQRRLRRYAGHARHLGQRPAEVGPHEPGPGAARRPPRLAHRGFVVDQTFNLQTEDNRDRFAQLPGDQQAVPPRRQGAGGRLDPAQPRPRRDVPADRARRHPRLLRRPARARRSRAPRSTRRSAADADLPVPPGYLTDRRPRALPGHAPAADPRRLPRATTSTGWRRPPAAAPPWARR